MPLMTVVQHCAHGHLPFRGQTGQNWSLTTSCVKDHPCNLSGCPFEEAHVVHWSCSRGCVFSFLCILWTSCSYPRHHLFSPQVLLMVGLPGCGKTQWSQKHTQENKEKRYTILGTDTVLFQMKVSNVRSHLQGKSSIAQAGWREPVEQ